MRKRVLVLGALDLTVPPARQRQSRSARLFGSTTGSPSRATSMGASAPAEVLHSLQPGLDAHAARRFADLPCRSFACPDRDAVGRN